MSENKGNHIKIITPELATDGTRVFVDGTEIDQVCSVEFRHHAGELAMVVIEFYPRLAEIDGEVMLERVE